MQIDQVATWCTRVVAAPCMSRSVILLVATCKTDMGVCGFLTPNKGIRTPDSLGRSRMIFLEVLKGVFKLIWLECWLLTLNELL